MRRGNDAAFEVLFERYRTRLLSFCRNMLRSAEDAEDVLQEVFVAAYKAILSDEREIAVRPWLYRISRNRCLNHLRRPVPDGQDTMDDRPFENGASTDDRVQKREEFRNLLTDVGELPETQKTALLLREIDAMSYEEIGAAMDTTIPSVKSLLVRARMSLAEASEARGLTCNDVRVALAEAAEGVAKASGPIRRHVRECEDCKAYRSQLRADSKVLAALFPIPLLVLAKGAILGKLGIGAAGGSGAAAGGSGSAAAAGAGAGAGAAGSSAGGMGVSALGSAIAAKATAGVVTAALITTGVVEMKRVQDQPPAKPEPQLQTTLPALVEGGKHHARHHAKAGNKVDHKQTAETPVTDPNCATPAPAATPAPTTTPSTTSGTTPTPTATPAPAPTPAAACVSPTRHKKHGKKGKHKASTDATGVAGSTGGSSGITSGGASSGGSSGGTSEPPPPPACEPTPVGDPGSSPSPNPEEGSSSGTAVDGTARPAPAPCEPAPAVP